MAYRLLAVATAWASFALELIYIFLGRLGSIDALMIAASATVIEGMVWSGVDEHNLSDFEDRLRTFWGAVALFGIVLFCLGLTIQKTRQGEMMKQF